MLKKIPKYKDLRVDENVDYEFGARCGFNGMVIKNDGSAKGVARAKVRIGRHFHSGQGCVIRTSDHAYDRGYPMVHGALSGYNVGDVTIGEFVWFGDDVLVMKGVTIGDGVIVQSRSVVVSDLPDLAIAGGHPCRQFSARNAEDYEFFKSLKLTSLDQVDPDGQRARFEARLDKWKRRRPASS
jgi:acetyltransferase-like isoleucine patch superfamily enzyme